MASSTNINTRSGFVQASRTPTRKVLAGFITQIVITAVILLLNSSSSDAITALPVEVEAAIGSLVAFVVMYVTPPGPNDGIVPANKGNQTPNT